MTDSLETADFATLSRVFQGAPVGAAAVGGDGKLIWVNDAFCRLVGRAAEDLLGSDARRLSTGDDEALASVARVHDGVVTHATTVLRYERPGGGTVWARTTVMRLAEGLVIGIAHEITQEHVAARRLRSVFDHVPVSILTVARDGRIVRSNPEAERLLGHAPGTLEGRLVDELVPARYRPGHPRNRADYDADPQVRRLGHGRDLYAVRADGSEVVVEISLSPVGDGTTQVVLVDVTERKQAEEELRARAARQQAIVTLGERALTGAGIRELQQRACEMVRTHLGVDISKVLEIDGSERLIVRAGAGFGGRIPVGRAIPLDGTHAGLAVSRAEPIVTPDVTADRAVGERSLLLELGMRSSAVVLIGTPEDPVGVLGAHSRTVREFTTEDRDFLKVVAHLLADATRRRRAEAAMRHQALHDPLTGLPNRTLLLERIRHWTASARRGELQSAAAVVDVDHFKVVNDALGHVVGDDLLRALAVRLRRAVRPHDTVARFGADAFAIFCEDLSGEADALLITGRIAAALDEPFVLVGGHRQPVTASVGVALSGKPAIEPDELLRNADLAMDRAKQQGRDTTVMFAAALHAHSVRRRNVDLDLRAAIDAEAIDVHFQPIVSVESLEPLGFEALARWTHPRHGRVPPLEFIALAEDTGLIERLCTLVLRKSAWQAVAWSGAGADALFVSVNLSPREVGDRSTVDRVRDVLAETQLAPERLSLEVTETTTLDDTMTASAVLADVRGLGVRISLDDFGTGFSSLSHAQSLPVDCLKIDRSFIRGIDVRKSNRAVVSAVTELAKGLGAAVVGEGVETAGEHEALRASGCSSAQGYFYARPMPASDVAGYLAAAPRRAR